MKYVILQHHEVCIITVHVNNSIFHNIEIYKHYIQEKYFTHFGTAYFITWHDSPFWPHVSHIDSTIQDSHQTDESQGQSNEICSYPWSLCCWLF